MKRLQVAVMGLAVLGTLYGATVSRADEAKPAAAEANLSAEKGKEGSAASVALVGQAVALVGYARENESPTAMLAAVEMLRRVRLQDGSARVGSKKSEAMDKGTEPRAETKGKTPAPTFDPKQLLGEAKAWAKGNKSLVALINAEAAKPVSASGGTLGKQGGAVAHKDMVKARNADDFILTFNAEQVARVVVYGDGDTDLDLYIYDENGKEIVRDDDASDRCVVQWTPKWTGQFRVRIVNRGYNANQYALATN